MSAIQDIVNSIDDFAIAGCALSHDLANIDSCDDDDRGTFIEEIRWALATKMRQAILLASLRENPEGNNESLDLLFRRALKNIDNLAYIESVMDYVMTRIYKLSDTFRPDGIEVQKATLQDFHSIQTALRKSVMGPHTFSSSKL
jgi:hypothetical protein